MQQLVIIGDEFVRKTAKNIYKKLPNAYANQHFEVTIAAGDKYNCSIPNILARMKSALVEVLNNSINIPKIIMLVPENDIIKDVGISDKSLAEEHYREYIKYFLQTTMEVINTFKQLLPEAAKRPGWPKLVIITPTIHRNYSEIESIQRAAFASVLDEQARKLPDTWALRLLQVWDKNNLNIVRRDTGNITNEGYTIFWKAVDRTVRFTDKKILKLEFEADLDPFKPTNLHRDRGERSNAKGTSGSYNRTWHRH